MTATLHLATQSSGKLAELQDFLGDAGDCVVRAPESFLVAETGSTFLENAELKARALAARVRGVALADDSGICVAALGGRPGIYSARLSGEMGPSRDRANRAALLRLMSATPEASRSATMVCALALAFYDGQVFFAQAEVTGYITQEARGEHGFGYDSVFCSANQRQTWAELSNEARWAQSHRRRALKKLDWSRWAAR